MQYTPYQPTWTNPYLQASQQLTNQTWPQPTNGIVKVNNRDSAIWFDLS